MAMFLPSSHDVFYYFLVNEWSLKWFEVICKLLALSRMSQNISIHNSPTGMELKIIMEGKLTAVASHYLCCADCEPTQNHKPYDPLMAVLCEHRWLPGNPYPKMKPMLEPSIRAFYCFRLKFWIHFLLHLVELLRKFYFLFECPCGEFFFPFFLKFNKNSF